MADTSRLKEEYTTALLDVSSGKAPEHKPKIYDQLISERQPTKENIARSICDVLKERKNKQQ